MIKNVDFTGSELWNTCSEIHKKTLICPNIFGHVLYENMHKIQDLNLIEDMIETGTYDARSSIFFSMLFNNVHTIELFEDINPYSGISFKNLYNWIKETHKNINFYFGDSAKILNEILLQHTTTRFLILLDAHTSNYSPILNELIAIKNNSKRNDHVIIIDDYNLFGTIGYPTKDELKMYIYDINKNYNIVETNHGNGIIIIF